MFDLDVTNGKVSVGGDGNKQISFTARPDIARFVSYVFKLLHLPPEQLKNRASAIAGDNKVTGGLGASVVVIDRELNCRSIKYSSCLKKRPGRSWMRLTSPFPNLKTGWLRIRRTLPLNYTSFVLPREHSRKLTTTCIPTGIRHV